MLRRIKLPKLPRLNWLTRFYLPLLLLLCAAYAWQPLRGVDDFWAHAAIGRWIWQHQEVPHQTLFLWSTPPIPWVYHSWLTQLSFYGLMAAGGQEYGTYLVVAFTVFIAALTFALIWRLWAERARITFLMPLIFALAIWCSSLRFHPRPELFTALFLVYLLRFLIEWSGTTVDDQIVRFRYKNILHATDIVILFALWANFHGAVAIGLMILAATIICDLVQDRFNRRAWMLALGGLLCAGAIFVNPYQMQYLQALKPVRGEMFTNIDEWKPFWHSPQLGWTFVAGEAVLMGIACIAWAMNPRRRWAHLAWLLLMGTLFVSARRHLWLLALVSLAVMAANASALDTERLWKVWRRRTQGQTALVSGPIPDGLRMVARIGALACLVISIVTVTPADILPLRATSRYLPKRAVNFINRRNLKGRIFNDYENSSYLQWAFGGQRPLFIDLLNAYPDRLLTDYFAIINADTDARGRKLLDQRKISYVVLRPHGSDEGLAHLAKFLNHDRRWKCVYGCKGDHDSTIWLRRNPGRKRTVGGRQ